MSYTVTHTKAVKLIRSINAERIIIVSCRPERIPIKEIGKMCAKEYNTLNEVHDITDPGIYVGKYMSASSLYEYLNEDAGWYVLIFWVFRDIPEPDLIDQSDMFDKYAQVFNNKFITVLV